MPRWLTNVLLGLAVAMALASGTGLFGVGRPGWGWALAVVHGVTGLVLLVLAVRKAVIVRSGWRARRPSRGGSVILAVAAVLTVVSGIAQSLGWWRLGPVTAIQVHVTSAVLTGAGVAWHMIVHPGPLRRALPPATGVRPGSRTGRRTAVRVVTVLGASTVALGGLEVAAWLARDRQGRRRFTGSHRLAAPLVTQWFDDPVALVDPAAWRLTITDVAGSRALTRADLRDDPARHDVAAVLDCTGGWYAATNWAGVPLSALVRPGPDDRSVRVISVTGYERRFPLEDLEHLVLATSMDGRALSAGHGAPCRLVAPGRRGFWWVKWVTEVRTDTRSWLAQPPFPLT